MAVGIGSGTTCRYPSYQSTHGGIGGDAVHHTIEVVGNNDRPAARPSTGSTMAGKRWALPLCALAALATLGIVIIDRPHLFLSSQYASMVHDAYPTVPLLGSAHNKIRAQSIAEQYRIESLGSTTSDEEKHRHGGHKHKKQISDEEVGAPIGCEATVMLLRHCEKENEFEHCNYVGYERAAYLPSLFGDDGERWPKPSYIYALNPGGRHNKWKKNFREVELILPLAEKANATVNADYGESHTSQLAKEFHDMLKSGEMCGKLAVISWKHEALPRLARHLGCGPVEGCPLDYRGSTFDQVWQIKFVYRVPLHPTTKKEAKREMLPHNPSWWVYGSTQLEGFDPLAFSKHAGDYPTEGKGTGASWMFDFEHDERWKAVDQEKLTKVGRLGNVDY